MRDVIVVGGGPAGLAVAAAAARARPRRARAGAARAARRQGLRRGAAARRRPGPRGAGRARATSTRTAGPRLRAIRWIQEDGSLRRGPAAARRAGWGSGAWRSPRRSLARAREAGAEVRDGRRGGVAPARRRRRDGPSSRRARSCGPASSWPPTGSPRRSGSGRGSRRPAPAPRRFGLRRHFALAPWTDAVEVHFSRGAEAYVTPGRAAARRPRLPLRGGDRARLRRPPGALPGARLPPRGGALRLGAGRGGPLRAGRLGPRPRPAGPRRGRRRLRGRHHRRGRVAGARGGASSSGSSCPRRPARGATREALLPWERAVRARHRRHAAVTRLVLSMARRPRLRRTAVDVARPRPAPLRRAGGRRRRLIDRPPRESSASAPVRG